MHIESFGSRLTTQRSGRWWRGDALLDPLKTGNPSSDGFRLLWTVRPVYFRVDAEFWRSLASQPFSQLLLRLHPHRIVPQDRPLRLTTRWRASPPNSPFGTVSIVSYENLIRSRLSIQAPEPRLATVASLARPFASAIRTYGGMVPSRVPGPSRLPQ